MGKLTISVALAALVVASMSQVGGMVPLALVLSGMLFYAVAARHRATLNANPQSRHDARARVAASSVSCDWVRPE